jgi:hypothetical protein
MNTLHTFGCSLTASTDWPNKLAHRTGYKIANHAVPAGDNMTQVRRFKNLILHNKIKNTDYIIWEITYLDRSGFRLSPDHHFFLNNKDNKEVKHNFHTHLTNILDNQLHLDYVAFNKEWDDTNYYVQNINEMLTDLLFAFKTTNDLTKGNVLVWFAQNNIFQDQTTELTFINYLDANNIKHLDYKKQSMMSWVNDNNYELADDKMHPHPRIYELYCETFLYPQIIKE